MQPFGKIYAGNFLILFFVNRLENYLKLILQLILTWVLLTFRCKKYKQNWSLNNGICLDGNYSLNKREKNFWNQKLSKMKKVILLHKKTIDQLTDFLNKFSTEIVKTTKSFALKLQVHKNHKLVKIISTAFWSSFVTKLHYKVEWNGRIITKAEKRFSSSRICSKCGTKGGKNPLNMWE